MLRSDRERVDQHPLDELDSGVLVEHAGRDHPVDVVDRQAVNRDGCRDHAGKSTGAREATIERQAIRTHHTSDRLRRAAEQSGCAIAPGQMA